MGKFGAFVGCSNYPECKHTRRLEIQDGDGGNDGLDLDSGAHELGRDPVTKLMVSLKKGPYGVYVEREAADPEDKKSKPKRQGLPKGTNAADVTLESALQLLALPREVGPHPETGDMIEASIGRFGPYLKYQGAFVSIKGDDDVLTIGMNRAVEVIATAPKKKGNEKLRDLGDHPTAKKPMELHSGRYGPYVKMGKTMASLPKGAEHEKLTLEEAAAIIDKKMGGGKTTKAKAKKAPAKKTATKKKAATSKAKAKPKTAAKKKTPAKE